ncbi:MAG: hypothetical protein ACPGFA_08490 [Pikeienuella sp.]
MAEIKRRDVYYFPGYDVQGVRRYYRYLVRQCGWYARRFDAKLAVGPLRQSDKEAWLVADVTAQWPEGDVQTRFHFCNWRRDIVQDYSFSRRQRYARLLGAWARMTWRGHTLRLCRKAPRFMFAASIPIQLIFWRIVVCTLALLSFLIGPLWGVIMCALAGVALYGLNRAGEAAHEDFFVNGFVYMENRLSYRPKQPDGRLGLAVQKLIDGIASSDDPPDEIMLVGHSYGGAPAIKAAQAIARAGTPVSVLTIGSISPFVSLDRSEGDLRPAVAALLNQKNACWRDYYAPQDTLSFPGIHPVRDFDLAIKGAPKADFKVKSAVFGEIVAPRKIRKFRWNLLRMHFHFIMAADVQGGYDWIRYATGPDRLSDASK